MSEILKDIAKLPLDQAAAHCAGNWQTWSNFVWFGEKDVLEPENVCLFYTTGPEATIADLANDEALAILILKPFRTGEDEDGDIRTGLVGRFGSSLHGDANALKGFSIRVYDFAGKISEAFKALHAAAVRIEKETILDQLVYEKVHRREWLRYMSHDLPDLCKRYSIAYTDTDMLVGFVDHLIKEEECNFDHLDSDEVEHIFCEVYAEEIGVAQSARATKLFKGVAERLPEFIDPNNIGSDSPGADVTMNVELPRLDDPNAEPDQYTFYMGQSEDTYGHYNPRGNISCCFHGEDLRHNNELVSKIPNTSDDVDLIAAWVKETLTKRQKKRPIDDDPTPKYRIVLEIETHVDPTELRWNHNRGAIKVKEITPIEEEA